MRRSSSTGIGSAWTTGAAVRGPGDVRARRRVVDRPDAGPDATPTGRTELSFEVSDITSEIRDLEGKGVTFADYDLPDLTTVDHVCVLGSQKAAWFHDPAGNVLCLHEVIPT